MGENKRRLYSIGVINMRKIEIAAWCILSSLSLAVMSILGVWTMEQWPIMALLITAFIWLFYALSAATAIAALLILGAAIHDWCCVQ